MSTKGDGAIEADWAVAEGRVQADFVEFYHREYAQVVRLAFVLAGRYELAEEIAQDAFVAARVRWDRVGVYDDPGAWVRKVATNRCISRFRKARNELKALQRFGVGRNESVELPQSDSQVWAALRSLAGRQAQVLALMFVEDRSPAEVAHLLGISEETVRTHARRGRQALARLLGQLEDEG